MVRVSKNDYGDEGYSLSGLCEDSVCRLWAMAHYKNETIPSFYRINKEVIEDLVNNLTWGSTAKPILNILNDRIICDVVYQEDYEDLEFLFTMMAEMHGANKERMFLRLEDFFNKHATVREALHNIDKAVIAGVDLTEDD